MKIFDDSVMDNEHILILVHVGVGIFFGRFSVRSPSRVANAQGPLHVQIVQLPLKLEDFSHGPVTIDMNVYVINDETNETGHVPLSLGAFGYPSQAVIQARVDAFVEDFLPGMEGFRLMTKREQLLFRINGFLDMMM